ncbi:MAG: ribonuclease III family protein, partial [Promethearchaeia archaeon]
MDFKFLIDDLQSAPHLQKRIGTDKGLAKIGDGIVNLTYSVAKSLYLSEQRASKQPKRTGKKVGKKILAQALKNAELKQFAKNRADAHDLADTAEAIIAYVWLSQELSVKQIIEILYKCLQGSLEKRIEERKNAIVAFTRLLLYLKRFLPKTRMR